MAQGVHYDGKVMSCAQQQVMVQALLLFILRV